jgi:hypothetical protein
VVSLLKEWNYFLWMVPMNQPWPAHSKKTGKKKHVPGIILLRRRISIGQLIEDLLLIQGTSSSKDYQDHIE